MGNTCKRMQMHANSCSNEIQESCRNSATFSAVTCFLLPDSSRKTSRIDHNAQFPSPRTGSKQSLCFFKWWSNSVHLSKICISLSKERKTASSPSSAKSWSAGLHDQSAARNFMTCQGRNAQTWNNMKQYDIMGLCNDVKVCGCVQKPEKEWKG